MWNGWWTREEEQLKMMVLVGWELGEAQARDSQVSSFIIDESPCRLSAQLDGDWGME